jgi:hypothetical protein
MPTLDRYTLHPALKVVKSNKERDPPKMLKVVGVHFPIEVIMGLGKSFSIEN